MIRIVTTYNPTLWSRFVKRNVESWLEHVEHDEIIVYHEEPHAPEDMPDGVVARWLAEVPGCMDFINEAASFAPACGRIGSGYDYNHDARKFAWKAFAQLDAADEPGADVLVWLDSDVQVLSRMPFTVWARVLADADMATYRRPGYHSETGVVVWDLCKRARRFFAVYRHLYESRGIYRLPGWHDCWALDSAIEHSGITCSDLCAEPWTRHHELGVVEGSELGKYLRHDKGALKYA